jgi:hypothetical protein
MEYLSKNICLPIKNYIGQQWGWMFRLTCDSAAMSWLKNARFWCSSYLKSVKCMMMKTWFFSVQIGYLGSLEKKDKSKVNCATLKRAMINIIMRLSTLLYVCKIWGFHGSNCERCCLLGSGAVYILCEPMFLRNVGSHKIYTAPRPRRQHSSLTHV